jgi:hypothetical protein
MTAVSAKDGLKKCKSFLLQLHPSIINSPAISRNLFYQKQTNQTTTKNKTQQTKNNKHEKEHSIQQRSPHTKRAP